MNSPGHRRNILNENFTTIGVGYKKVAGDSKNYNHYWVQLFGKAKIKPNKPKFTLTTGKKKATVKWKKVSGASGYKIYASTSKNKNYKLLKTIKGSSIKKFTKTNLKNKFYHFKLRAYKIINGYRVYSDFTSSKRVKPKK